MIKTITKSDFTAEFHRAGRGNQFTHKGLLALYDYLEDYEVSTGESIELDVIAICCDYTEYESLESFQEEYGEDYQSIENIEQDTLIMIDDTSFIIHQF